MKISGLQKLTLLDYPGKVACTLFTCGCNLRCPFCHNMDLVVNASAAPAFPLDEIFDFLKERVGKLEGVAITGGEPLLHDDMDDLLADIRKLGYSIKLDTNGFFPERLKRILDKKLVDMVAMDIKSGTTNYDKVSGITEYNDDKFDKKAYLKSIDILLNSDIDYEFRTTCVNGLHTEEDFHEIKNMIKGAKKYFLQSYRANEQMEHLPFSAFEIDELTNFKNIVEAYVSEVHIRGL